MAAPAFKKEERTKGTSWGGQERCQRRGRNKILDKNMRQNTRSTGGGLLSQGGHFTHFEVCRQNDNISNYDAKQGVEGPVSERVAKSG